MMLFCSKMIIESLFSNLHQQFSYYLLRVRQCYKIIIWLISTLHLVGQKDGSAFPDNGCNLKGVRGTLGRGPWFRDGRQCTPSIFSTHEGKNIIILPLQPGVTYQHTICITVSQYHLTKITVTCRIVSLHGDAPWKRCLVA